MNDRSREILRRVEQNDATLTELYLRSGYIDGFSSSRGSDYSKLGACIGENTHLTKLYVNTHGLESIPFPSREFARGLQRNSSIRDLVFCCSNNNIVDVVAMHEILDAYQENNSHLTQLTVTHGRLENGGDRLIANTLRRCTNLKKVSLQICLIADDQLLSIIEAGRQRNSLEVLYLDTNRIGNDGCVNCCPAWRYKLQFIHTWSME